MSTGAFRCPDPRKCDLKTGWHRKGDACRSAAAATAPALGTLAAPTAAPAAPTADSEWERATQILGQMADYEFSLAYVDYNDRLTDEQMSHALAGRIFEAETDVWDAFEESRFTRANELAQEIIDEHILDVDEEELRLAIQERDTSDVYRDLSRNTPAQLVRNAVSSTRLDRDGLIYVPWNDDAATERVMKARTDHLAAVLGSRLGLDAAARNYDVLRELVDNGPSDWHEGIRLDFMWASDIDDLTPSYDNDLHLTVTNPSLVLIDTWNGSGHEVSLDAAVNLDLPKIDIDDEGEAQNPDENGPGRVFLDTVGPGRYGSWDGIAGLVKSAFRRDVTARESTTA